MIFFEDKTDCQSLLAYTINELDTVNTALGVLIVRKERLVNEIIASLGHQHDGHKTYDYDGWKIEVKTPSIYSLDKKKYESGLFELPDTFNPIKQSFSYTIDKKLCEQFMINAPIQVRDILCELIDKKPGKANVVIKERY